MTQKEREEDNKRIQDYINTPGKLPMHAFRPKLSFTISKGLSFDIDDLIDDRYFSIDYDVYLPSIKKNLQRNFVWKMYQKQELILSILKGIRIAEISVIHSIDDSKNRLERKTVVKVIDGKQRLSTVIDFVQGGFGIYHNDSVYYYQDLTNQAKREILGCLRFDVAYEYQDKLIPDSEKIAWFEMINFAGTPQDAEHLKNLKS